MRKMIIIALGAVMLAGFIAVPVSASHDDEGPRTYSVTITNETQSQWLTPPNWAGHSDTVQIFNNGDNASPGLQQVAENGGVPVLAEELAAVIDARRQGVSGVAGPAVPIGPGESRTFEYTSDEDNFSLVAMLVCTNDGFAGIDSANLPHRIGRTRTIGARAYDAGTEINTEVRGDLVPAPFCGEGEGSGETNPELAENGKIRRHGGISGDVDLGDEFDFHRRVAKVTITRVA